MRVAVSVLLLGWFLPVTTFAAAPCGGHATTFEAVRVDVPPELDGRLDDAAWDAAPGIDHLCQTEPIEGGVPTERTVFRVVYDSDFLYVGVRAYDREPDKIIRRQLERDGTVSGDDRITIAIDTFHDHRNGYMFQVNANGSRRDFLIVNNDDAQEEWDGIWDARSIVDAEGWSTEIALPMKTLNFDPDNPVWGFNILRAIRRRNETVRWAAVSQNVSFINLAEAGDLTGLRGLEQGLGLDVIPASVVRQRWDNVDDRQVLAHDPGLDLFYKFTPSLTGAFTTNTDFSEAPVDTVQVNLTRFSLFFPEQRDFFLQDAGIFQFADLDRNGIPFFSRRIGLDGRGVPVDLRAATKLTGRIGRLNVGALGARTAHRGTLDPKLLGVGRISLNVGKESSVGAIGTVGDSTTNLDNALVGFDGTYRRSDLFGDQVIQGNAWFQQSFDEGVNHDESAWGAALSFPNDRINGLVRFSELERNFRPGLGFVNRRDVRQWTSELRFRHRPETWLRSVDTGVNTSFVTSRGGRLQSGDVRFRILEFENQAGDELDVGWTWLEELIEVPFGIAPGIVLQPRRYGFQRWNVKLETTASRRVQTTVQLTWGTFFTGSRLDSSVSAEWRPIPNLLFGGGYEQRDVRLAEGDFTVRIVSARLNVAFNPRVSWTNFVQYDNSSDAIGLNSRLRWIHEPGREFFVIFNPGFRTKHRHIESTVTDAIFKVKWTLRF